MIVSIRFEDIDQTSIQTVGGKGKNLGQLGKVAGICVPRGFCVTTEVFQDALASAPAIERQLERLAHAHGREAIEIAAGIRHRIEACAVPAALERAIEQHLGELGPNHAYAVRSSATAEDLPTASSAGQYDSYLGLIGRDAILQHVRRCWASLFTERAVAYRLQHGVDHRKLRMAVVVQRMVDADVSGVLFTADPLTSNRRVTSIEASAGLGEALVDGLVNADRFRVRDGEVVDSTARAEPTLTRAQLLLLERLGRAIETHFGVPQDVEWCIAKGVVCIVQSRPITTLYPVPEAGDSKRHVFLSVGHQQMMTDAMKPLGRSLWKRIARAPMYEAGGRLFVDVAPALASAHGRQNLLAAMAQHDPLIVSALETVVERGFIELTSAEANLGKPPGPPSPSAVAELEDDPAIVAALLERSQASLEKTKREIQHRAGTQLFDFLLEDIDEMMRVTSDAQSMAALMAAVGASAWLNQNMQVWLGEKSAADTLSQSVPNNVTSEMGLKLLAVADVIRPYPAVAAYLQGASNERFFEGLLAVEGGSEACDAIQAFLREYGMRCAGEIDITRPRWSERPAALVPMILGNLRNTAPNAGTARFERGREAARAKEHELLARLARLPDGADAVRETKRRIARLRTFAGYREYPKYAIVSRLFVYKQALMREAEQLLRAGVVRALSDVDFLGFEELREVVRTRQLDLRLVEERKREHARNEKLSPPRVITSEGEIILGKYQRGDLPAGALVGLAVSSGVVEGRARVILKLAEAELEPGDILITRFTDPSWTPLFVGIAGLITEVGGLMTHGAVIAREYGLPAIVGVERATERIQDGQRIRLHGAEGYVELL